jgi:hypothetical protein
MPVHTIALWVVVVLLSLASVRAIVILYRYSGARVITCPENHRPAGVHLNLRRVLASGFVFSPSLSLSSCSRWPERAGCGQDCLRQIEASPEDCLVRSILAHWFADKKCVFCGQQIGSIEWAVQKPALLIDGRVNTDCGAIAAERLPDVLATARAVCFSCHTATRLVREHPELIVDRPDKKNFP